MLMSRKGLEFLQTFWLTSRVHQGTLLQGLDLHRKLVHFVYWVYRNDAPGLHFCRISRKCVYLLGGDNLKFAKGRTPKERERKKKYDVHDAVSDYNIQLVEPVFPQYPCILCPPLLGYSTPPPPPSLHTHTHARTHTHTHVPTHAFTQTQAHSHTRESILARAHTNKTYTRQCPCKHKNEREKKVN